jgi:hypothetical protein
MGACYVAERPLGAWVEVFRRRILLAEAEVRGRTLLSTSLGREVGLADLTSRRALQFGVTASLGADDDYADAQAFAADAVASGFAGVRYLVRHDPSQRLYGVALFASAGPSSSDTKWPRDGERAIPSELIAEASRLFGYRVLPTP